jgi:hypothetical protein
VSLQHVRSLPVALLRQSFHFCLGNPLYDDVAYVLLDSIVPAAFHDTRNL